MKLMLRHERSTHHCTAGTLQADTEDWRCFTLEIGDPIPPGRYDVVMAWSAQLKQALPALRTIPGQNVIGYFHPGTRVRSAPRHIVLGMDRAVDIVIDSQRAFSHLMAMVEEAGKVFDEQVTIEVIPFEEPAHA